MEVSSPHEPPFSETKSFPGRYESLARIGDFVRAVAKNAGFDSFGIYSIEMAVDEACSNIIEHAYEGEGGGNIRCTCTFKENAITITLHDQGKSFDPSKVPPPNLSQNIDERKAHGLGLFFIHKWMDEVIYKSNGVENILIMKKRK